MPTSPDTVLEEIEKKALVMIKNFVGDLQHKSKQEPVAFGLKSLIITFLMEESKGSTEELENQLAGVEGVNSVDVTDVRRAIG